MNITELKELAAKATPGPWKAISRGAYWDEEEGDVDAVSGPEIIGAEFVEPLSNQQTTRGHCWYRDAAYIAAANPAAILELIARLELLQSLMERQKDEWLSWEAKRRDLEKAASKLEDAQGEIRALRATEAGLLDRLAQVEAEHAALLKAISDAEPVAWDVYVEEADNGYLVDSLDDPQLADDCTNHNAVVTPLYTLNGIKKP